MENAVMYCLKCKQKEDCRVVGESVTKNNRRLLMGRCIRCDAKANIILGKAS